MSNNVLKYPTNRIKKLPAVIERAIAKLKTEEAAALKAAMSAPNVEMSSLAAARALTLADAAVLVLRAFDEVNEGPQT